MTTGPATPTRPDRRQLLERRLRRMALIGGMAALMLISLTMGSQFIYLLATLGVAGAYIFIPDEIEAWFEQNEPLMVGAAIGFIYGNIPGMLVGGWLGHYINRRLHQGAQAAQAVVHAVEPFTHPVAYTQRGARRLWQRCVDGYNWLMEEEPEIEVLPNESGEPEPQQSPNNTINDPLETFNEAQSTSVALIVAETIREAVLMETPPPIIISTTSTEDRPVEPETAAEPEPPRHSRLWHMMFGANGAFPNRRAPTLI